jgi:hypothetical protein
MLFKTGDKVRILLNDKIGVINSVASTTERYYIKYPGNNEDEHGVWFDKEDVEEIEEKKMTTKFKIEDLVPFKFAIGDKVIFLYDQNEMIGTVSSRLGSSFGVRDYFVTYGDHSSTGQWLPEEELEKEEKMKFKIGDKVKVKFKLQGYTKGVFYQDIIGEIINKKADDIETYLVKIYDPSMNGVVTLWYAENVLSIVEESSLDKTPKVKEVCPTSDQLFIDGLAIRKQLKWFITLMEAKLQKNDHKRSWSNLSVKELKGALEREYVELEDVCDNFDSAGIIEECVDVANYCMMIADNIFTKQKSRLNK